MQRTADATLIDAVRESGAPADRRRRGLRPADGPGRRRALRAARRGVPRHARVLPRARRDHEAADRGEGLHGRRGRGRLARRLPRQPLRARRERRRRCRRGARRLPALPDLDVAQHRRGRVRRVAARPQRRAPAGRDEGRLLRSRPLQPARLDGGRAPVSRGGRPRGGEGGARALRLLRPLRRGRPGLRFPHGCRRHQILRGGGRQPAGRAAAPRHGVRATRRPRGRGRVLLTPSRTPAW